MSVYRLSRRSRQRLTGVHPALIVVVERALTLSRVDFAVTAGSRTLAEQREMVDRGASKTLRSKHLPQADGYAHAVDLVAWVAGAPSYVWALSDDSPGPVFQVAAAMRSATIEVGGRVRWGAVWDRELQELPAGEEALQHEVNAYTHRRRLLNRSAFLDGPHFEVVIPSAQRYNRRAL